MWEEIDTVKLKDKTPLNTKWLFKVKQNGRYKARLVVKGCKQREIDYTETYSQVISATALITYSQWR